MATTNATDSVLSRNLMAAFEDSGHSWRSLHTAVVMRMHVFAPTHQTIKNYHEVGRAPTNVNLGLVIALADVYGKTLADLDPDLAALWNRLSDQGVPTTRWFRLLAGQGVHPTFALALAS